MLEKFHHQDREFDEWRKQHKNGFFINDTGRQEFVLHRVGCSHLKFSSPVSLTRNPKHCSDDKQKLEAWAKQKRAVPLKHCSDCNPD